MIGRKSLRTNKALRNMAEGSLAARRQNGSGRKHPGDLAQLVHELEVREIELELQNEELKGAHAQLEEARDRYANLFDFAPVGYVSLKADNVIAEANLTVCRMLDVERKALLGKPFTAYIDKADLDTFYLHRKKAIGTGTGQTSELKMRKADGGSFYAGLESRKHGEEGLRVAVTDISLRRQMEETLKKRSAQIETANSELAAFAYSVAHDLRAPLRAIDGFLKIIVKSAGMKLDEEERRRVEIVRENARRMGKLIDDLLSLSRLGRQALALSVVNMEDLVNQVWAEMQHAIAGRSVELRPFPLPRAYGDSVLIKQVLVHLLANALKFTRTKEKAVIEVGCSGETDETATYYVKDNGIGFNMAYANKLFGVFQRLHESDEYEGTGVGLALVQRVIRRHEGQVWAESKENAGATFYFTLPKKAADASSPGS